MLDDENGANTCYAIVAPPSEHPSWNIMHNKIFISMCKVYLLQWICYNINNNMQMDVNYKRQWNIY